MVTREDIQATCDDIVREFAPLQVILFGSYAYGTGCLLSRLIFLPLPSWYSCLLPPIGLTGTYFYQPDPPLARLIGKSPEYVAVYTSTYKSKRGGIQARWASAGCISAGVAIGTALVAVGVGIGIGAAAALQE